MFFCQYISSTLLVLLFKELLFCHMNTSISYFFTLIFFYKNEVLVLCNAYSINSSINNHLYVSSQYFIANWTFFVTSNISIIYFINFEIYFIKKKLLYKHTWKFILHFILTFWVHDNSNFDNSNSDNSNSDNSNYENSNSAIDFF